MALEPKNGQILWKYDVGPKPEPLDPPITIKDSWGDHVFHFGPATSSRLEHALVRRRDRHDLLRHRRQHRAAAADHRRPAAYTRESCAIIALDVRDGAEKWVTQINPGDVWTNAMRAYDPKEGRYKDQSIGDTPKIYTIPVEGKPTKVVGVGCKNGGFYVLRAVGRADPGPHPDLYRPADVSALARAGPADARPAELIGGLQTGCATDGRTIFTNGIDCPPARLAGDAGRQRRPADGRARGGHRARTRGPSAGGTNGPRSPRWAGRRPSRSIPTSATPSPRGSPSPTASSTSRPSPAGNSSPSTPAPARCSRRSTSGRSGRAPRSPRPRLRRHGQHAVHARGLRGLFPEEIHRRPLLLRPAGRGRSRLLGAGRNKAFSATGMPNADSLLRARVLLRDVEEDRCKNTTRGASG